MMKLSPLNLTALLNPRVAKPTKEPVQVWQCGSCEDVHDSESDAKECCADQPHEARNCPICAAYSDSAHNAASCCLWKDFDMATRHRIADAVEAGSTWLEAIEAESKKH